MPIVRVQKHHNNYVIMDKTGLEDERLSIRARGLLAVLLAKPESWEINLASIAAHNPKEGREAILNAMHELEACGYAAKQLQRDNTGKLRGYVTVVYETPDLAGTEVGKTEVGKTEVGKTEVGKTEVGKTEVGKTEVGKTHFGSLPPHTPLSLSLDPSVPRIQRSKDPKPPPPPSTEGGDAGRQEHPILESRREDPGPLSGAGVFPLTGPSPDYDPTAVTSITTPEAFVALYNANIPPGIPEAKALSPERRQRITKYLHDFPDRLFWITCFRAPATSPFLRGERNRPGHERFKFDIDFLLRKGKDGLENCVKVYEGKYADQLPQEASPPETGPSSGTGTQEAMAGLSPRTQETIRQGQRAVERMMNNPRWNPAARKDHDA